MHIFSAAAVLVFSNDISLTPPKAVPVPTGVAKGVRNQCVCQTNTREVIAGTGGVWLRCALKASAAKGCAKPKREHGNGGRGGARAGAASAVAVRNEGFRSIVMGIVFSLLQLF